MHDIGKHIRQQRLRQNMTQDDLAQRIHATRQTVSNCETGRSQPDLDTLHLPSQALECGLQILLYGQAHTKTYRVHFTTLPLSVVLCVLLLLAEPAPQAVVHSPITIERAAALSFHWHWVRSS